MITEAWFPDTGVTDRIMARAMDNTARRCLTIRNMLRAKVAMDSSICHISRGNRGNRAEIIQDTADTRAMAVMGILRSITIIRVMGPGEAPRTLLISSSNKRHSAAELDSLPNIKPLGRNSSGLL
jgi:hypothetical protein